MVRFSRMLHRDASIGLSKTLSEILVCPLSKRSLSLADDGISLISDSIGVSFPIKDGIPCLVPNDGKILDDNETTSENVASDSTMQRSNEG